ncbi:MAG: ATP-dependent helicase [Mollicutes bacterium PWAP]|nr:ATP-dependent helicase [Mollicutes bacterium PWAP]
MDGIMNQLEILNKEQLDAVKENKTHLSIIAGPGSGKTTVISTKYWYLINELGVNPKDILGLTFTNKAAKEMSSRISKMINIKKFDIQIKTFHSLALSILKEEISLFKFDKIHISIPSEQRSTLKKVYKIISNELDMEITNSMITYSSALSKISNWKLSGIKPSKEVPLNISESNELFWKIYFEYSNINEKFKYLDFDDLIIEAFNLINDNKKLQIKWEKKYKKILVDEFQDTSIIQYKLLKLLSGKNVDLIVVGDPDQTIYTWRNADPLIFKNYLKDFKPKIVKLVKNYRSDQQIVKVANLLIKNNKKRPVPLKIESVSLEKGKIVVFENPSQVAEAKWIVDQINQLKANKVQLKDIVVLYRSQFHAIKLESFLKEALISYNSFGSNKFFDREEIQDAYSLSKIIINGDWNSFVRVINKPSKKIGSSTINKISSVINTQNNIICELMNNWSKITTFLSKTISGHLLKFIKATNSAIKLSKTNDFGKVLIHFISKNGYYEYIKPNPDKIDNINSYCSSIDEFLLNNDNDIDKWLEEQALISLSDKENGNTPNHLNLMTVHSSKGLEFDYVFVLGFSEEQFPSKRALTSREDSLEALEEERRLAYVAITRAKKGLFLSVGHVYDQDKLKYEPSRFVKEMKIETTNVFSGSNTYTSEINLSIKNHLSIGNRVKSLVFGEGEVLSVVGQKVTIKFDKKNFGIKTFAKNHPSLTKIQCTD